MGSRFRQRTRSAAIVSFSLQLTPLACKSSLNVDRQSSMVDLFIFCRQLVSTQLRGGLSVLVPSAWHDPQTGISFPLRCPAVVSVQYVLVLLRLIPGHSIQNIFANDYRRVTFVYRKTNGVLRAALDRISACAELAQQSRRGRRRSRLQLHVATTSRLVRHTRHRFASQTAAVIFTVRLNDAAGRVFLRAKFHKRIWLNLKTKSTATTTYTLAKIAASHLRSRPTAAQFYTRDLWPEYQQSIC